ncbi:MAG: hypothetical protein KA978_18300 [Deltaproteobacteria bacterium]|nr:hypothetical protein [Deltaproteobacteria bacterium]
MHTTNCIHYRKPYDYEAAGRREQENDDRTQKKKWFDSQQSCLGALMHIDGAALKSNLRLEQVAHEQLDTQHRQVALQKQSIELHHQVVALQGQQLTAQQQGNQIAAQQLAVQLMQLQMHVQQVVGQQQQLATQQQQLATQQQQLQIELQREQREATENEMLRRFVDAHEVIKNAMFARQQFDAFWLLVGAERIYAELYSGIQNANSRLTISALRDKHLGYLGDLLNDEEARKDIALRFAEFCRPHLEQARALRELTGKQTSISEEAAAVVTLSNAPDLLSASVTANPMFVAKVQSIASALRNLELELGDPRDDAFVANILVVPSGQRCPEVLSRWRDAIAQINDELGGALGQPARAATEEIMSLRSQIAAQMQHCAGVESIAHRARSVQTFLLGVAALDGWSRGVWGEMDNQHHALPPAVPVGIDQAAVSAYVTTWLVLQTANRLAEALSSALKSNAHSGDENFLAYFPTLLVGLHDPAQQVVPWVVSVFRSLSGIHRDLGALTSRCRASWDAMESWKKRVIADDMACTALARDVDAFLPDDSRRLVAAEVQRRSSSTASKVADTFRSAAGKESKARQTYVETALEYLCSTAALPRAIPPAPVVYPP